MTWKRFPKNTDLMEQWVLYACGAPLCKLYKGETVGTWQASFLNLCGKTNVVAHCTATSLEQAQRFCEKELRLMGWKFGGAT